MADRHDMTIGIGLKADLEGGVQTEKQLERLRKKAKETSEQTRSGFDQVSQSFGRVSKAAGAFSKVLSGFGMIGIATSVVAGIKSIIDSFRDAKKEADEFAKAADEKAIKDGIDDLSKSYAQLTDAISKANAARTAQKELEDIELKNLRDLEDAQIDLSEQKELGAIDGNDPAAAERRAEIQARYKARRDNLAVSRGEFDGVRERQDLRNDAAAARKNARQIDEAAAETERKIREAKSRRNDALARSVSENEEDLGTYGLWGKAVKKVLTLNWGSGWTDTRSEAGDKVRAEAQAQADSEQARIDQLTKQAESQRQQAERLREDAAQKEKKAEALQGSVEAQRVRRDVVEMQGAQSVSAAVRATDTKNEQISKDEALIAGAAARRAGIQARIDEQNAAEQAAADRANKEDQDVYLARRRLARADAENRGKGWNRYVKGDRRRLEDGVQREEREAEEARSSFERTKNAVAETLQRLNEEMRRFESDLKAAQSRMKVNSEGGNSQ